MMSVGFGLAGIVRPEVIVGFLDLSGSWQPDILMVLGTALVVTFISYRLIFKRPAPLLGDRFMVPTRRDIDARLIVGSVLFGAGWGVTGYCPGPVLASLATGRLKVFVFLGTMVLGMVLYSVWDKTRQSVQKRNATDKETTGQAMPDKA
jgi:hypothetical protein